MHAVIPSLFFVIPPWFTGHFSELAASHKKMLRFFSMVTIRVLLVEHAGALTFEAMCCTICFSLCPVRAILFAFGGKV